MGVVYRAEDLQLGRTVALKFLPAELTLDDEAKERFLIEARAASRLDHPNICTVHDLGQSDDGRMFIVMACYEGESLAARIARGPLPPRTALDVLTQIARGLAKAHEAGIVHRDIKPGNIIVTPDGVAKILDFGIAKLSGVSVTRDGMSMGTLAYMAPEQFSSREVTPATDVWSLGVVLYEMLSGHIPFDGDAQALLIGSILHNDPEPIEVRDPEAGPLIADLLARTLAKNPRERYASAGQLLARLEGPAERTALRISPVQRRSRNRLVAAGVALALILAVAFAGVLLRQRRESSSGDHRSAGAAESRAGSRRMIAVMPFQNLGQAGDAFFADGITDEIISRLATVPGLGVISRTSVYAYQRRGRSARDIGRDLGVEYILEGTVQWEKQVAGSRVRVSPQLIRVGDDTQVWSGRYERDFAHVFAMQAAIAQNVIEQLGLRLSAPESGTPTSDPVAYESYLRASQARFAYSEEELRAGIAQAERAVLLDPAFATAHALLGHLHVRLYHHGFDRAQSRLGLSEKSIDRALLLEPGNPEAHVARGYLFYWGRLDHERALAEFMEARKALPGDATLLASIGFVHRRQGKLDLALSELLEARRLDPHNQNLLAETAQTLAGMRRFRDADDLLARGIAMFPQHSFLYMLRFGNALTWTGSTAQARQILERAPPSDEEMMVACWYALALFEGDSRGAAERLRASSQTSFVTTMAFGFWGTVRHPKDLLLAQAEHLSGDDAAARESYRRAERSLRAWLRENPNDDRSHAALGLSLAGLGRRREAIAEGEKAVALCPVDRNAVDGSTRMVELARIYTLTGDEEKARAALEKVLQGPATFSRALHALDPGWRVR